MAVIRNANFTAYTQRRNNTVGIALVRMLHRYGLTFKIYDPDPLLQKDKLYGVKSHELTYSQTPRLTGDCVAPFLLKTSRVEDSNRIDLFHTEDEKMCYVRTQNDLVRYSKITIVLANGELVVYKIDNIIPLDTLNREEVFWVKLKLTPITVFDTNNPDEVEDIQSKIDEEIAEIEAGLIPEEDDSSDIPVIQGLQFNIPTKG